ncbi:MAG: hypothetical protein H0X24_00160 [Ktedonobacterales bacterium]|nr:hypothetical protein [Ktedonobacterales bacterium]
MAAVTIDFWDAPNGQRYLMMFLDERIRYCYWQTIASNSVEGLAHRIFHEMKLVVQLGPAFNVSASLAEGFLIHMNEGGAGPHNIGLYLEYAFIEQVKQRYPTAS